MAAAVTVDHTSLQTPHRVVRGTITFDNSYPTGGEAVTPGQFGLTFLTDLSVEAEDGYVFQWNRSTSAPKVLAYWVDTSVDGAPLAEVTATTDLSAAVVRYTAIGR